MKTLLAAAVSNFESMFAQSATTAAIAAPPAAGLRSLPNEDVFLFVKDFDNSLVVREADPGEGRMCWRAFAGTVAGATVLIGLLLPSAAKWVAGHQIEQLRREQSALEKQRGELVREISELKSMRRLDALAAKKNMTEPSQRSVGYLQPAPQGALAMNLQSLKQPGQ
jgi:hypothetical protein